MGSRLQRLPETTAGLRTEVGSQVWQLAGRQLATDRPIVLGILNVTPDSFSDGGEHADPQRAVAHALRLVDEGADLIDVGGESSRPGSNPVDAREEWRRIGTVAAALVRAGITVSVDTTKADVARRALDAGAAAINDISGLRREPAVGDLAAEFGAGLIVMHMRGEPRTMQAELVYGDLLGEVAGSLQMSIATAVERGCSPEQVVVDPGIGFGKSLEGNLELLAGLHALRSLGRPVLVGTSRKSFLGQLLDAPADDRLEGTIASCVSALDRGARLFRVHDVEPVRRALDVADAIRRVEPA